MVSEEALRKQAVQLHLEGKKVATISRELHRSRQWVHKWINRYNDSDTKWNVSQPNTPNTKPNKTSSVIVDRVIETRKELISMPYMESGAYAIWHHLQDKYGSAPSVATINRILKQHGMLKRKIRYQKSGVEYPPIPLNTQIMDLIGPRYFHGGQRFYLLTIISNDTRHAGVYPILSKSAIDITQSVVDFWKSYSVPDFLQMDNELSFKGSNRHPRGLGLLLRTALSLNVTPIFIPVKEPWRDGVIERFNRKVENTLLQQEHANFDDLIHHAQEFVEVHNRAHHYSTLGHKTPLELDAETDLPILPLNAHYQITDRPQLNHENRNEIQFRRLVRSDLTVNILNTNVMVLDKYMHTYIEACLLINEHRLLIKQDGQVGQEFEFVMPLI